MTNLHYVVDASVAIKLFVEQPMTDPAIALFSLLVIDPMSGLYVPDLFFVECANVLWQYVRRTPYPVEQARQSMVRLKQFALKVTPTGDLVSVALDLAIAHRISAYDACYLALAQRLEIELVTADQKLVQTLAGTPYRVRSLNRWTVEG